MAKNETNKELNESISLVGILSDKMKDYQEEIIDAGEKITKQNDAWTKLNKVIEDYSEKLKDNTENLDDTRDLVEQQLEDTKELMKTVREISQLREGDTNQVLEELNSRKQSYELLLKELDLRDELVTKAELEVDTYEKKIRDIPLIGDMLASKIDFGGLKEQMGGVIGGIAKNFTELTNGGMAVGPAIAKSFTAAIPSIASFGAALWTALAPILPIILAIVAAMYLWKKAFAFSQDVADLSRDLGISNDESREMMHNFYEISATSNDLAVNATELVQAQKDLSEATGLTAQFSEQMLTDQIKLTKFMGLTGEEAANFQRIAIANGQTARELQGEIAGTVEQFNNATGSSIALKDVLAEIATMPAEIRVGFNGTNAQLAQTVALAKTMGTTLEDAVKAGEATLDIETSLKDEAKARILTGVNINNNAIRAAQIAGDYGKVLELQREQLSKIDNFNEMAPYQQKAIADAMGMTVDEVVKQKEQMELAKKAGIDLSTATLDQLRAAKGLTAEEKEQLLKEKEKLSAQEKLDAFMTKLEETAMSLVGPILDLLDPLLTIVDFILPAIGPLMKFAFAPLILVGKVIKSISKMLNGDIMGGLNEMGTGILEFIYRPFILVIDLIKGFFPRLGAWFDSIFDGLKTKIANLLPEWANKLLFGTDNEGNANETKSNNESNVVDSVNDGIITPEGDVIKTNPADYLMAMVDPFDFMSNIPPPLDMIDGALDGIGNMFGGGGESTSIDYDKLAEAISKQPIMISIDGKVVSQITRVQTKQSSFRK